ncbi:hypothetical protein ACFPFX_28280 [Streptomyces mauvecolor]|uniref:Uncharacterized protein n=1 Tax=Streptomyces mauvecolor TaxID=58345 RepID=A0ABV9UUS3_9ACTN
MSGATVARGHMAIEHVWAAHMARVRRQAFGCVQLSADRRSAAAHV